MSTRNEALDIVVDELAVAESNVQTDALEQRDSSSSTSTDGAFSFQNIPAIYSKREERANALTHGIGIPIALAMLVALLIRADGMLETLSALVFGMGMVCVFTVSTLYHVIEAPLLKQRLRVLDHATVYLMIASLYTPYMLVSLIDQGGIPIAIIAWCVALLGILMELVWVGRPKWMIGLAYVILGWGLALKSKAIYGTIGADGFWLLVAGGTLCSLGVIFYVQKNREFMHAIFHTFILAAVFPTWLSIYSHVLG